MKLPEVDPAVVQLAIEGDRDAFAALYAECFGPLLNRLLSLTHSRCLAEDLTQDTFMSAFVHIGQLHSAHHFSPWLSRIAYFRYLAEQRTLGGHSTDSLDELLETRLNVESENDHVHTDSGESKETLMALREYLSETEWQTLCLSCVCGYHAAEIALFMGVTVSAAEKRIARAKVSARTGLLASGSLLLAMTAAGPL